MNYKDSGVDITAGDNFTKLIGSMAKSTANKSVLNPIGSFNSLFKLDLQKYYDPVLVSSTDGVGTKLKYAFQLNKHNTIGIDLVAMCVNDILTCGADPLFFLDYFATGKLDQTIGAEVIKGIIEGCNQAGCCLVGGETAEMPGFYQDNEYDVAGFVVGAVNRPDIIDGSTIQVGDAVIGIASSGLHSNGFSLARKVLESHELSKSEDGVVPYWDWLLAPTIIYREHIDQINSFGNIIKGMAHITGGGLVGNIPRILPGDVDAVLSLYSWERQPIFNIIQEIGQVTNEEMFKVFNMGIGFVVIVSADKKKQALDLLNNNFLKPIAFHIGTIEKGSKKCYLV